MKGQWEAVPSLRPERVRMWLLESGGTRWKLRPLGEECALCQSVACRQGAGGTDILTFCFLPSNLLLMLPPGQTHPEPEGKEVQPVQPRGCTVGGGGGGGEGRRSVETGW